MSALVVPVRAEARATARLANAMRPAEPRDLPAMALIHVGSGTHSLLTNIGRGFLQDIYYRRLLDSPLGRAQVIELGGRVVGFVTHSLDSDALYRRLVPPVASTPHVLRAAARHPSVLVDLADSALHVVRDRADIKAEVISLEVDAKFQGLGLGYFLLQRAVDDLRAHGAPATKARILEGHAAVEALYVKLGFRRAGSFRLHRRPWVLMVWDGTVDV